MAQRKDNREFRVYLLTETYRLLQSIAAIRDCLVADDQQKTIDRHRLNEIDEPE
jgi:CRISPR/Cas system-associated protein endoribonuclease Cas2